MLGDVLSLAVSRVRRELRAGDGNGLLAAILASDRSESLRQLVDVLDQVAKGVLGTGGRVGELVIGHGSQQIDHLAAGRFQVDQRILLGLKHQVQVFGQPIGW